MCGFYLPYQALSCHQGHPNAAGSSPLPHLASWCGVLAEPPRPSLGVSREPGLVQNANDVPAVRFLMHGSSGKSFLQMPS